jgi:glycosyltransferase involved in cell wall biosynthesis
VNREHDKDPDTFISVLLELVEAGLQFRISMLGQSSADVPHSVTAARHTLGSRIVSWGRQDRREDYLRILSDADVVVSTAIHEFFGVAM